MENLLPVKQWSKEFIDHVINNKTLAIDEAERNRWKELKASITQGISLQQNTANVAPFQIQTIELG